MCLVAQLCPTLCDPMDCSPPGSSVCGDSPGKNTGGVAMPSSRGSSRPRDGNQVFMSSCTGRQFLYHRLQKWTQMTRMGTSTNMCPLLKLPRMLPLPRWRRWHREIELCTRGHTAIKCPDRDLSSDSLALLFSCHHPSPSTR